MLTFFSKLSSRVLIALALVGFAAAVTQGAIVTSWDLSGDPGNQATEPAAFSAPGVTGGAITRGAGLSPDAGVHSFGSNNWDDQTADEYIEFGFTVQAGTAVDLESLIIATRSSATGPGTIGLYTSLDGFASAIYTFVQPSASYLPSIVPLSALPTLTAGEFLVRLVEIGNTQADGVGDTSGVGTFRIGEYLDGDIFVDVQFTGTFVPETGAFVVWAVLIGMVVVLSGSMRCRDTSLAT